MPYVDGKWTWDDASPCVIRAERMAQKAQEDLKKTREELDRKSRTVIMAQPKPDALTPQELAAIDTPIEEICKSQYLKDLIEDEKLNRQLAEEKARKEHKERMAKDKAYRKQVRKKRGFFGGLFRRKRNPIEEFDEAEGYGVIGKMETPAAEPAKAVSTSMEMSEIQKKLSELDFV